MSELLSRMTLAEKVGQMRQADASHGHPPDYLGDALRAGEVGSVINNVDVDTVNEMQRIAVEESRLGIPLLVGRDVIHGFRTVLPIPLGQAATWNPELVQEGAREAAREAAGHGVNWTFAPMIDITREPRWGRIAESPGEDPVLACAMASAMVRGFQGEDLANPGSIAACAKHFAGYGEVESGRDYATTNVPENELRNVHLRPFRAAVESGVATLMTSFSEIDGVPGTANTHLLRDILRGEWSFDGCVVSDWDSVRQLSIHGLTGNDRESALAAATAGVDMEMAGDAYLANLAGLVDEGRLDIALIDTAVANILRAKFRLGLFDNPFTNPADFPKPGNDDALAVARRLARESVVLLKNESALPLAVDTLSKIAVVGPLADAGYEQLGTWIFDGDEALSVSVLDGIREFVGDGVEVFHDEVLETSRSRCTVAFRAVLERARDADAIVLVLGEESILSGEAHSRADIGLPGAQEELVHELRKAGKPLIAVVMAGRPLTLTGIVDEVDALLYAWHPGAMGGPALAELLFGVASPSGKLPVTMPRMVGQVPIYYNHKNSGKPPSPENVVHIDDIERRAPQTSLGMSAFHLDAGYRPLWPFGFGLSYARFEYSDIRIGADELRLGDTVRISAQLHNAGDVAATEVAQLYVRDLVGNVTRPVRELKGFRRVALEAGETQTVEFELHTDDLAFYGRDNTLIVEPGEFHAWIGGDSDASLQASFRIVADG